MILVCETCAARYLVPATVFERGPRTVRCARCGHEWDAGLPVEHVAPVIPTQPIDVVPPIPSAPISSAKTFAPVEPAQTAPQPESPIVEPVVPPPVAEAEAEAEAKIFDGALRPDPVFAPQIHLPALQRRGLRRSVIASGIVLLCGVLAGGVIWGVADREVIVKHWPRTESIYQVFGLRSPHPGDGFSLQNITSERRADDGVMQLVVSGEVRNDTAEPLDTPAVEASAIGADNKVLQSWPIEISVGILGPGVSVPFQSIVRSPEGSVAEINLRFITRPAHDDQQQPTVTP